MIFADFYRGKTVLVTGHTGFKGGWLTVWLQQLGATVVGYGLPPETTPSLYSAVALDRYCTSVFGDIRDRQSLDAVFQTHRPEIVFHLAAQPLVRYSYAEPILTYETNVMGTLNVLEAARRCPTVKAVVNVTSDKCYENKEVLDGYRESDSMGGYDMYSSSKGCVELMSASFRRSFLAGGRPYALGNARAGNVIGGGDWAVDRLIPDCVRAIESNCPIEIRNPAAIRPWQHVLEPLSGYLILGKHLIEFGDAVAEGFNFGPNSESVLTVHQIVDAVIAAYGRGEVLASKAGATVYGRGGVPIHQAVTVTKGGSASLHTTASLHEANLLTLNIEKAAKRLDWHPRYTAHEAIAKTIAWYQAFYHESLNPVELMTLTASQIQEYEQLLWTNTFVTR